MIQSRCTPFLSLLLGVSLMLAAPSAWGQTFADGLRAMQQNDADTAYKIWKPLSETGDPDAQYGLALLLESGGPSFQADLQEAARLYELAAAGGIKEAKTNLGLLYAQGRGVTADPSKAVTLWQDAARENHDMAQYNLGIAYYGGNGIEANLEEAVGLIYAAASNGLGIAQLALAQFYRLGIGLPPSKEEALYWFNKAQQNAVPSADQFVAGLQGEGVQLSPDPNPEMRPQAPSSLQGSVAEVVFLDEDPASAGGVLSLSSEPTQPLQPITPNVGPTPASPPTQAATLSTPTPTLSVPTPQPLVQPTAQPPVTSNPVPTPSPSVATGPTPSFGPNTNSTPLGPTASTGGASVPNIRNALRNSASSIATGSQNFGAGSSSLGPRTPTPQPVQPSPTGPTALATATPSQGLPQGPTGQPAFNGKIPELITIEPGQGRGILYAAWLGTTRSKKAAETLWASIVPKQPDIFTQVQPGLYQTRVSGKTAYRLLAGPFPSKSIAWQVCNAFKIRNPDMFCKAYRID